ncbi:hypothetical protein COLO4_25872 [Corchorus olitorius]|uniref:Uncharacterized protein n=1 Tax=Corchorus olitorius TaxID=93759 RepID=A0A1R3HZN9_9ROSI|nr:hypothetical protein COLO4_25872 [Corchorus olitorius]
MLQPEPLQIRPPQITNQNEVSEYTPFSPISEPMFEFDNIVNRVQRIYERHEGGFENVADYEDMMFALAREQSRFKHVCVEVVRHIGIMFSGIQGRHQNDPFDQPNDNQPIWDFNGNNLATINEEIPLVEKASENGQAQASASPSFICTVNEEDMVPLVIQFDNRGNFRKRPYRFEMMWTAYPVCKEVIKKAWYQELSGSRAFNLVQKLKISGNELQAWNKSAFGNLFERKIRVEAQLGELQERIDDQQKRENEEKVRAEMVEILEQEQLLWIQKSRANWIVRGERNTRTENQNEIEQEFIEHFKDVFSNREEASEQEIRASLDGLLIPSLIDEHNQILEQPFSREEIKTVAFQINPLKALGIDGKPVLSSRLIGILWEKTLKKQSLVSSIQDCIQSIGKQDEVMPKGPYNPVQVYFYPRKVHWGHVSIGDEILEKE